MPLSAVRGSRPGLPRLRQQRQEWRIDERRQQRVQLVFSGQRFQRRVLELQRDEPQSQQREQPCLRSSGAVPPRIYRHRCFGPTAEKMCKFFVSGSFPATQSVSNSSGVPVAPDRGSGRVNGKFSSPLMETLVIQSKPREQGSGRLQSSGCLCCYQLCAAPPRATATSVAPVMRVRSGSSATTVTVGRPRSAAPARTSWSSIQDTCIPASRITAATPFRCGASSIYLRFVLSSGIVPGRIRAPAPGFRDAGNYGVSGALWYVGNGGYTWSSSVSGTYSVYLLSEPMRIIPSYSNYRAYGLPVRCLQHLLAFCSVTGQ